MRLDPRNRYATLAAALLLVSLACSLTPAAQPTALPTMAPTAVLREPTLPPAASAPPLPTSAFSPVTPVPADQTASAARTTDSAGVAAFTDPLNQVEFAVTFQDAGTEAPLPDLVVSFVSNGAQVLVFAQDPAGTYAPRVQELAYADLAGSFSSGKLARTSQLSVETVLGMVTAADCYRSAPEWVASLEDLPDLEAWSRAQTPLCFNPEQAGLGLVLALDLPMGWIPGLHPGLSDPALELLEELHAELQAGTSVDLINAYSKQTTPSILRFTVYSFGDEAPKFLRLDGFCLPPLDRRDPESALDWLRYGLENKNLYAFQHLARPTGVSYAYYIEGGQENTVGEFLTDLDLRNDSDYACQGINNEGWSIQVWTSGWTPPWEITEICYVECSPQDPPWQSTDIGFFLWDQEGEWWLSAGYLNTPDNYFFSDSYELSACDIPFEDIRPATVFYPTPVDDTSCPGAPDQRLVVDQRGTVCTTTDAVILRAGPGQSNPEVIRLGPGVEFTVTDGPACAGTFSWWEVQTADGTTGWAAEGGDETDPYFLCPAP